MNLEQNVLVKLFIYELNESCPYLVDIIISKDQISTYEMVLSILMKQMITQDIYIQIHDYSFLINNKIAVLYVSYKLLYLIRCRNNEHYFLYLVIFLV